MPRHMDFLRIYTEFCNYYKEQGETEYYDWLHALKLDETKEYGHARESFYWKKEDIAFIEEDTDNKYYEVEVGFPTKSMNGNIYKERDLIAGALTLKGKHPSLNHKAEFWFSPENPHNRWGNIELVDGKYHEGSCKALIQVPKETVCPICNGKPMTELIDNKKIVNVSLEGDCASGRCYDGTCNGFYFTDPPFTFLTTDILPGIPLTRIKPLESIMVEALHRADETNQTLKGETRMKIKARIIEDKPKESLEMPNNNTTVNTNASTGPELKGTFGTPIDADAKIDTQVDLAKTAMGTPAVADNLTMKSGTALTNPDISPSINPKIEGKTTVDEPFADYTDFADCVAKNSDKDDPKAYCGQIKAQTEQKQREENEPDFPVQPGSGYAPTSTAIDTSMPKPETHFGGSGGQIDQHLDMPEGAPTSLPSTKSGAFSTSHHNTVMGTSPIESLPLEDRVARLNAESNAKAKEAVNLQLQKDLQQLMEKYSALQGSYGEQRKTIETLTVEIGKLQPLVTEGRLKTQQAEQERLEAVGKLADATKETEKWRQIAQDKMEAYNKILKQATDTVNKNTTLNEQIIQLSADKEQLEDKLQEAIKKCKQVVRLKV